MTKITICGAGRVGSVVAFECFRKELGDIVLWNRTASTAKGIALDIQESGPLLQTDASIIGTNDYRKTKNSTIIIITAGAQRKAGMSRDDLTGLNSKIVGDIVKNVIKYSKKAILIIVSNPLDAMVYIAKKISKFPKQRLIGMAGVLDTSRYKSFIAQELQVSVEDIHAMVLGSHGDSMVPLPRHTSIKGIPLTECMSKAKINKIIKRTRVAGAEIIRLEESSAFFSPGISAAEIAEAIIKDKKRVLPCSAYLTGEYGVKGIFMGVPCVIGKKGVEKILKIRLNTQEKAAFMKSAKAVKKVVSQL